MLRNIQMKIIITFMVLGILLITTLGMFFVYKLDYLNNEIIINDSENIGNILKEQVYETRIIMYTAIGVYLFITLFVGIIVAKVVIAPISKLVKSAEMIAKGEHVDIKYLDSGKPQSEIDDLVGAFSMMHEELKENLNEVSRQKRQIETILLHMTDGIIAFNMEGNIIHINTAAKTFLMLNQEDNTFEKIFQKLDIPINMEKIIYLENWTSSEQKVDIDEKSFNLFFAPFKDEVDRPAGVIVVIQDITEHVKLDLMRKEFVADVSHELKTPITSIMGYADTLMEGEVSEELNMKFLGRISSEAKRMAKLVSDLLTLSRYDNDGIITEKTEFDLGELVKDKAESLSLEIQKKNQNIECFVTANVPPVYADRNGIERVVLNILTNSIKYTPEEGTIKIYVGFVYNDAYIKIIDNGIGIPEDDLNKIFERFYRVDKARTREMGGTGLGLSIAKEILDKNNARIDIKSEVGKGTEVVIRIPTKNKEKEKKIEKEEV